MQDDDLYPEEVCEEEEDDVEVNETAKYLRINDLLGMDTEALSERTVALLEEHYGAKISRNFFN